MRVAALYDIHGNLPALEVVLREVDDAAHALGRRATGAEQVQGISTWPLTARLEIPGLGEVVFCHATPRNDMDIFTRLTPEAPLVPVFEAAHSPIVICGHTHMQFDRMIGRVRVVNAGSVGMPFGDAGADWLLLGPGVELRHASYDLVAAATRVRATRCPNAEEVAARYILNPPTEEEMLKAFAGILPAS